MASQASTLKKSQYEVAEVSGLSPATVSQIYKLMLPKALDLFPTNFQFETPFEELPLN
jgi:transcription initiation factor TFIIB